MRLVVVSWWRQVYRALIQAGCLSLQQVSEMLPLLAVHERNNYVLSAAIRACERENEWKMALRFYDDMTKGGLQPDDLTITQLLRVLAHTARCVLPRRPTAEPPLASCCRKPGGLA